MDEYILRGTGTEKDRAVIERYHARAGHKLNPVPLYGAGAAE